MAEAFVTFSSFAQKFMVMYPHVLMLAYQFRSCDEGSILRGDLLLLLQAMRNRSIQPTRDIEAEDDEYDTSEIEEEEFQFQSEKRFPVCEGPRVEPATETNNFITQVFMISDPTQPCKSLLCLHERLRAPHSTNANLELGETE